MVERDVPRPRLREDQWARIHGFLKTQPGIYAGREASTRCFVEAVLWMARSGSSWRLLPDEVGNWNSVYKRFARWQEKGIWQGLLDHLSADADLEWVMIDSTVVRAHACAAGAKKKRVIKPLAAPEAASAVRSTPCRTVSATPSPLL